MKNILAFLMIALLGLSATRPALAAPGEAAAELTIPTPIADDPSVGPLTVPGTELPELPGLPDLPDAPSTEDEGADQGATHFDPSSNFQPEPIATGEADLLEPAAECEEYSIFDLEPALLESTGTWLRRGFWYTEVDAVILNREFNKNNQFPLMAQISGFSAGFDPFGRVDYEPQFNSMYIASNKPDVETMPRIKIGRFLFRDQKNRDHTAEFTWFGGGQWTQQSSLEITEDIVFNPNTGSSFIPTLQVPNRIDRGNPSFDGATSSRYEYSSRFNSLELNYHLKRRLHRDQMIMQPDGEWVRAATPTLTRTFLTGLRYFELNDNLAWDAFEVPVFDENGSQVDTTNGHYQVRTENDLFGMQIGTSLQYETARWSLGVLGKTGIYLDKMFLKSSFNNTNSALNPSGGTDCHEDAISYLSEVRLQGKWHLRPNFSLRAGAELLYVKSVALSPYQVNFVPGNYSDITTALDPGSSSEQYNLYLGFSAGFEGYW